MDKDHLNKQRIEIVIHLGRYVTAYREKHQMTKTQFARECGVSVGFLRRLERGEANPTLDMIEKLAKFMGANATEILFPY